jgi:FG-GAP repeat
MVIARTRHQWPALTFLAALALVPASAAQTYESTRTLRSPNPTRTGRFGYSVAAKADRILVGSPGDNSGAPAGGAAYLFDRAGVLLQTLRNPAAVREEALGHQVAFLEDDALVLSFSKVIYRFDAVTGALVQTYAAAACEGCYPSLAVSGGDILLGSPNSPAHLLDGATGGIKQSYAPPNAYADYFGNSVAAYGDRVFVGASNDSNVAYDGNLGGTGAVYVFDRESGQLMQTLRPASPQPGDRYGYGTLVHGSQLLVQGYGVTLPGAQHQGAAFLLDAATGAQVLAFSPPIADFWISTFAQSAVLDDGIVVIGHLLANQAGSATGAVHVFDRGTGDLLQTLGSPTPAYYGYFGQAVAADTGAIVVGEMEAPAEVGETSNRPGAVHVFERVATTTTTSTLPGGCAAVGSAKVALSPILTGLVPPCSTIPPRILRLAHRASARLVAGCTRRSPVKRKALAAIRKLYRTTKRLHEKGSVVDAACGAALVAIVEISLEGITTPRASP